MTEEILNKEQKANISREIDAEIKAEAIEAAEKAYREKLRKKKRQELDLEEQQQEIFMDLPDTADRVTIDGVAYMHGMTYTLPTGRCAVLREAMFKAWGHEAEINGKRRNFFAPRNNRLNMATGSISGPIASPGGLRA